MKKKVADSEVTEQTAAENTAAMDAVAQPSKGRRVANIVINVVLVLAIIVAALCTYTSYVSTSGNGVPSLLGIRILSIKTESMYPTLNPGDLIFDTGVKDTSALRPGDIITYWTVIDGERVLNTHRITEIYNGGGYLIFQTKGDNNTAADPLTVHESEIVGMYKGAKIGGLGKVFDYLQTSTGFLIVVVIPVAIFFLYHLIQFFRVLFEYNNIKNKLQYEKERGKTEDLVADEKRSMEQTRAAERKRLEEELRAKLREELTAANAAPEEPGPQPKAETAEEMEARIRAELAAKAEAEQKAKEEAEKRAAMETELRAKIQKEMEEKAAAEAAAAAQAAPQENADGTSDNA